MPNITSARITRIEKRIISMTDIDTTKLTSVELVDQAIVAANDEYVRKSELFDQIKQSKNDSNSAFRENLKEIKEQIDEVMGQIKALKDHKKLVHASTD